MDPTMLFITSSTALYAVWLYFHNQWTGKVAVMSLLTLYWYAESSSPSRLLVPNFWWQIATATAIVMMMALQPKEGIKLIYALPVFVLMANIITFIITKQSSFPVIGWNSMWRLEATTITIYVIYWLSKVITNYIGKK